MGQRIKVENSGYGTLRWSRGDISLRCGRCGVEVEGFVGNSEEPECITEKCIEIFGWHNVSGFVGSEMCDFIRCDECGPVIWDTDDECFYESPAKPKTKNT